MGKRYDKIFKENLQEIFPQVLSAYTGIAYEEVKVLPVELVKSIEREPDFLYRIRTAQGTQILHVDVQTKYDASMHQRMYLYSSLLFDKYRLPVKQIVLFIGSGKQAMPDQIEMPDFTYQYQLIDFRRIPYRSLLDSDNPAKALFAILGDFGEDSKEKAAQNILAALSRTAKNNPVFFRHLQVLAELRKLGAFIKQIEEIMALDIRDEETTLYKAGIRHGKAEGKAQGKAEVAARLLRRGMSLEAVAEVTGLNLAAITKIKEK